MSRDSEKKIEASNINRRKAERHPIINFVWYKVLENNSEKLAKSPEGISKMCDISATGIGLYVTEIVPVGKNVFMEVIADKFNLSMIGEIVHSRVEEDGYFRLGISFVVVPPNDRLLLSRMFGGSDGKRH
jgi:c-di-GMP-binding flagellar brake protein YcgR